MHAKLASTLFVLSVALGGMVLPSVAQSADAASSCPYSRTVEVDASGGVNYTGDDNHVRLYLLPLHRTLTFSGKNGSRLQSVTVTFASKDNSKVFDRVLTAPERLLHLFEAPLPYKVTKALACSA